MRIEDDARVGIFADVTLPVDPLPPCLTPAGRARLGLAAEPALAFARRDHCLVVILLARQMVDMLTRVHADVAFDVATGAEKTEAGRLLADRLDLVGVRSPPVPRGIESALPDAAMRGLG